VENKFVIEKVREIPKIFNYSKTAYNFF